MNKRAMNQVVLSIIALVGVLLVVTIIGAFVFNTLGNSADRIRSSPLQTALVIQKMEVIDGLKAKVVVKRNSGDEEYSRMRVILSNDFVSQTYESKEIPNAFESKTYEIPLRLQPTKIEVFPIAGEEDEEEIGASLDYSPEDTIGQQSEDESNIDTRFESLVAHYSFDGGTIDSTRYNDGVIEGPITCLEFGRVRNGCVFDGSSKVVANASRLPEKEFTISLWMNPREIKDANLISLGGSEGVSLKISQENRVIHSGINEEDIGPYTLDELYHVALTYDGAQMQGYINGNLESTTDSNTVSFPKSEIIIGQDFVGLLDEIRIYNRALLQEEVEALANA